MKKTLYKIVIFLNYIFALFLIFSYSSVHISPDKIPFLSIFGLFFPFLILINILFLLFIIYKKKAHFLISLIALLLGINHVKDFYAFNTKKIEFTTENSIKILSYNVRMFDLYNWSEKKDAGEKIFQIVKNEDADIICLQELYSNKKNNWIEKIIASPKTKDYVISSQKGTSYSGNAIFSRYPIIKHGYVDVGSAIQKGLYADILKLKDTIRVYNIHLASVHLSNDDYKFMKNLNINNINNKNENIKGVKGLSSKLLQAYKTRSLQVDEIAPHIAESPYKTIVCGDFNDTPISYTYRKLKGELKDAFIEAGFGIGNTYSGIFPFFRIDYIMHSNEMSTIKYRRIKKEYSDHYPIVAEIEI